MIIHTIRPMQKMNKIEIEQQVDLALAEDIGSGDVTASLLPADQQLTMKVISREQGVLCGQAWFDCVFSKIDKNIKIKWLTKDGNSITANQTLCELKGNARHLLSGERAALNFLQTLSATATATSQYVKAINTESAAKCQLLDTRKTIPGLRNAQKYAVRCGGGMNHRAGLYDMVLIKENHIASAGSISAALQQAQTNYPELEIEIEVETIEELQEALQAGAKRVLLDNFSLENLRQAIELNKNQTNQAKLEASGNVSLDNIAEIAKTGVDFISIGAITKHIKALDLSMLISE